MLLVVTSVAALYCAAWIVFGIRNGRVLDNLARMSARGDGKFEAMLVSYGVGFGISATLAAIAATRGF